LIPLLRPDIVIQRLFGISDWDLLIAPNWGLKKTQIQTYMEKEIERREIVQGSKYVAK
jgi:radical SAM superfamily enzyme